VVTACNDGHIREKAGQVRERKATDCYVPDLHGMADYRRKI
jgi:hypothetical protein